MLDVDVVVLLVGMELSQMVANNTANILKVLGTPQNVILTYRTAVHRFARLERL
tara:strand:- start:258 stop:419 length:162 start_codon:yes stop_codon:yes gene_type:complete